MNYTNTNTNTTKGYNQLPIIFLILYTLLILLSILGLFFPKYISKIFCYNIFINKKNNKISNENLRYSNPHYSYFEIFFDKLDNNCSICLEKFSKNDSIYITDCNHYFHKDCIIKHFKNNYNCPLCRRFVYDTYDVNLI